ncbi:hypothetical protein Acy02nite_10320 [Actinoplanes cyaneus]|uniref:Uncharacterized protein n=1 Tax=Actinoplanes cyaneus TaxID=52696 RepID=A0A919IDB7_9ACTN|nr:hypothetical protein [Actinoplanes cyaneus]MCW2137101.1 hypothetical protein [Actinoplanes cyaneus]GID63151.1 hypothetical protein Acy02nite_10320 [Actinoplanes cyaneus]
MTVPLARSSLEAHLFIDITPCDCGESRLPRSSTTITLPDGTLGVRYSGVCPSCGRSRVFEFRLPEFEVEQQPDRVTYGSLVRSELIDAGQWVATAARYAALVPDPATGLTGDERRIARTRLNAAVSAVFEAERFLTDESDEMPESAFWSVQGRELFATARDQFHRDDLADLRSRYEARLRQTGSRSDEALRWETPEDAEYRQRLARLRQEWAERHGITDIYDDRQSTEAQRLELRRAERALLGLDVATGASMHGAQSALSAFDSILLAIRREFPQGSDERDRRTAAAEGVRARWCAETGCAVWDIDDDVFTIPDDRLPPAESAWAMVRAAREAAGQDPVTGDFVEAV